MVLPLEVVLDERLSRSLQNRAIAVADLAVSAVDYQRGQRRETFIMAAIYQQLRNPPDPVAKGTDVWTPDTACASSASAPYSMTAW